jgi:hypothetical protein
LFIALLNEIIDPVSFYFVNGLLVVIMSLFFIRFLFTKDVIKGEKAEYEFSPLLDQFTVKLKEHQEAIPETAECAECGKQIFKPFRCGLCKKLLCGQHYLAGDHACNV